MILWPSYLHNGISYTDKITCLYLIGPVIALPRTFNTDGKYKHYQDLFLACCLQKNGFNILIPADLYLKVCNHDMELKTHYW